MSEPREGIEIITPAAVWRLASGSRSFTLDGKTFHAEPVARGAVSIARVGQSADLELHLPVSHAFAQRYLQQPPPRVVEVNVYCQQPSGDARRLWTGLVTSCAVDEHVAKFRVISRASDSFLRQIPTLTVGKACPHMLYDDQCRVARSDFRVSTTIATISGNVVTVASMSGKADQFARFGELVHLASGERMPISDQTGTTITMQFGIVGMEVGDSVEVYAGCDHTIGVCDSKFSNVHNFGGEPQLPEAAVFLPTGFGLYQSE